MSLDQLDVGGDGLDGILNRGAPARVLLVDGLEALLQLLVVQRRARVDRLEALLVDLCGAPLLLNRLCALQQLACERGPRRW